MMGIKLHNKHFSLFIDKEKIAKAIQQMAEKMNDELKGQNPIFIPVLNGSFMFAADLLKQINIDCEVSFVKLTSYQGTESTGKTTEMIGLGKEIKNRTIVFLEDIVDTGYTVKQLFEQASTFDPQKVFFATLLFKPEVYKGTVPIDYTGIEIPNAFVVGYGLDYNGLGRNLGEIYIEAISSEN